MAGCLGVLVLLSGCSSGGAEDVDSVTVPLASLTSAERRALVELTVRPEQLSELRHTSEILSTDDVVALADLPDLEETLEDAGFRGGIKQEYRGVSARLTGVESQVLAFASDAGAAEFAAYLAEHAGAFFGEPITVTPVMLGDLEAWRIDPPVCDCAGAQPLSAGAARVGSNVVVLQITGPEADQAMMKDLLVASVAVR